MESREIADDVEDGHATLDQHQHHFGITWKCVFAMQFFF